MLFEAAIGDAYGVPFEYNDNPKFENDLAAYYKHPRHNVGLGRYTDDTEMSTAVAEAILAGPLTRESLAEHFVRAFYREKREGYAQRFYDFLCTVRTGAELLAEIKPYSDKSGAAMRGWVIGIHKDIPTVLRLSDLQATITHDTVDGRRSARAAAMMTHYFLYQTGHRAALPDFLDEYVPSQLWAEPHDYPIGSKGMDSVHAAVQAIVHHDNLADILKACVAYGGDVDTAACIALGAASCSIKITNNLPEVLIDGLENGAWGRDYLHRLDDRLAAWMAKQ